MKVIKKLKDRQVIVFKTIKSLAKKIGKGGKPDSATKRKLKTKIEDVDLWVEKKKRVELRQLTKLIKIIE